MLGNIRNNATSFGVKIIFAMIIIVFIFWGINNFRSSSPSTVAEINGDVITQQEFAERYNYLVKFANSEDPSITFQNAEQFGLAQAAMQELILEKLTDQICAKFEISVSGIELRTFFEPNPAFHGADGKFSPTVYKKWLDDRKILPGRFEAEQISRLLDVKLRTYLGLSVGVTDKEARDLYGFTHEKRVAEYALFPISRYEGEVNPTPEQIQSFYESNQTSFRRPEMFDVSYVRISQAEMGASFEDARRNAEDFIVDAPALESVAEKFSLKVEDSGQATEEGLAEMLKLPQSALHAVRDTVAGSIVPVPLDVEDGVVIVRLNQYQAAGVIPVEEATAQIVAAVKRQEAAAIANAKAAEAISGFKGRNTPKDWSGKLVKSEPFSRYQQVPGLAGSQVASNALFASNQGEWVGNAFSTDEGTAIVRVSEIVPVAEAEWEAAAADMKLQMLRNRQDEAYRLFMYEIFDKSEVSQNSEAIEAVIRHLAGQGAAEPGM